MYYTDIRLIKQRIESALRRLSAKVLLNGVHTADVLTSRLHG